MFMLHRHAEACVHAWQAGAHVEDLRTRCPYFYEVALRLDALGHFAGLGTFVHSCFQRRYKVRARCPRCPWRLAHTGCSHIRELHSQRAFH